VAHGTASDGGVFVKPVATFLGAANRLIPKLVNRPEDRCDIRCRADWRGSVDPGAFRSPAAFGSSRFPKTTRLIANCH